MAIKSSIIFCTSNILADREYSACCYLFSVSNIWSAFHPRSAIREVAELLLFSCDYEL